MYHVLLPFMIFWCIGFANNYVTIKVEPKTEECFYEDVKKGDEVHFEYRVMDGGLLDVDIRVFHGTKQIMNKLYFEGRDQNYYDFVGDEAININMPESASPYGFCFNNEMSRYTVKTIQFQIQITKKNEKTAEKLPMQDTLNKISRDLYRIESQQQQYRIREHLHRNLAEDTNSRVYIWSLIESGFLILICIGQVFYLRRLFSR